MKKGFTLSETVVALSVILIIVVAFYSSASFVQSAHQRTMATNFGVLQVENIKNIFDASTFENANMFSDFNQNIIAVYGEIEITTTQNSCNFQICTTLQGGNFENGAVVCNFAVDIMQDWALLSAQVMHKNKIVFQLEPYQKAVMV